MDFGKKYIQKLSILTTVVISVNAVLILGFWLLVSSIFNNDQILLIIIWLIPSFAVTALAVKILVSATYKPLNALSEAIIYAGHSARGGVAPDTEHLRLGREMITALAMQVYDLASMSKESQIMSTSSSATSTVENAQIQTIDNLSLSSGQSTLDRIALPIIGLDSDQVIRNINRSACEYLNVDAQKAIGKPFYDIANMAFDGDNTFEAWYKSIKESVLNGSKTWERVRITDPDGTAIKQFDLVASFGKQTDKESTETVLVIFDRTDQYSRDDREISFVALAVHELRTPLTIMRGYIEVFEDEVGPTLDAELTGFMHKMHASAQQLTAFVGNILNVARIEENQLVLKLEKHDWTEILKNAVNDLALRAGVHGKHIELQINGDIPPVAVDQLSVHEVINNLVDNAIKYSGNADKIVITTSLNSEGLVETSVQDFGIGIPAAVMPELFQKFYRSHKSRVQIGGTGLGLYLCKSIVTAHDGNIWVRSKEGEGSIFTFTLQQYDHLKHEQSDSENGIMRGAHGWIKNHSLNRQ